ncbi:MAG: alpha-amylase family glycosyl hydrolase [Rhodoluna sp.]|nr:alpha-amylase family glycosyl hydrolase [Rhodoluna sp.]
MTKKSAIYAWVLVLALIAAAFTYFSSPSRAAETAGSDGPVYLYDGNYALQDASDKSWAFNGEVYASESASTVDDPFTCPAQSTGAFTFISDRGKERTGTNGWNAAATQIFPAGSKNLLEVNFTPSANVIPLALPQASIKLAGGQYSLGVACTSNNGVTVVAAWYRYIDVTAGSGNWTSLPNSGGGDNGGGNGGGDNGGGNGGDPTLGQGTDGLTLTPATTANWVKNSVYYDVNPRNFGQNHSLSDVTAKIPALKALGVGVIVLEPIFPVSQTGKPGAIGDIYAPSSLDSVNPDLGTEQNLTDLVSAAHAAGLKILMTWVSGSIGNDSTWVSDHSDWIQHSGINNAHPVGKPYATLLDYSSPGLRAEIITLMKTWATNFEIDGFVSADAARQPIDFWNETSYRLNLIRPLALVTNSPVDATYKAHSFGAVSSSEELNAFNGLSKGTTTNVSWNALVKSLVTANTGTANLNFVTDYATSASGKSDVTRLGAFLNSAIALTYVLPGAPIVNAGQEVGYAKALKPYDYDSIIWPAKANASTALLTKLAKLRTSNTVLTSGKTTTLSSTLKTVLAVKVTGAAGTVYYFGNLSKKAVSAKITLGSKGTVYDFATGKKLTVAATQTVAIPASGYVIYTSKPVK